MKYAWPDISDHKSRHYAIAMAAAIVEGVKSSELEAEAPIPPERRQAVRNFAAWALREYRKGDLDWT